MGARDGEANGLSGESRSPFRARSAELVGREGELATITQALREAAQGRGGVVFVTGEPGIGKTRLAARAIAVARGEGMSVLRGRCTTTGPAVPFRPLAEALLAVARAGEAPSAEALGPYLPVLGRLVPEWSTGSDGDQSPVVLAEGVLRLTSAYGRGRGCLLVIDDLHDADPETLAVVEYLAANLGSQPVVVVATVRSAPSAASALATAVAQRQEAALLALGRLDAAGVHALTASCLGCGPARLPAEVSAEVFRDSQGVPFLAEELIRGMLNAGRIAGTADGGWALLGEGRRGVPVTLVRVVEERVARLGPGGARVLSVAAVLGQRFPLALLRHCAGLADGVLLEQVELAVAEGLLQTDEERGGGWYTFAHPLAVEALLSLLSPVDRVELSAAAADGVVELYPGLPGSWCLVVARLRAHAEDPSAAASRYLEAAGRALSGRGPGSAVTVLDEARRMLGDAADGPVRDGVHRRLLETLLLALADDGQFDRAAEVASRLRRADHLGAEGPAEVSRRVDLHVRLAWAAEVAGRYEEGLAQVAEARALLPSDAAPRDTAGVDAVAAYLTVSGTDQGRTARGERLARRAIEGARQRGEPALACQAWYAVGFASRGRSVAESDRCFRETLRIATEHELMSWRAHGLLGLGGNAWLAEGATDALSYAKQEASRTGCVSLAQHAGGLLALDAALRSDFGRAAALVDGSLDETRRLKLHAVTWYALMVRGVVAAHQGDRARLRAAWSEFRASGGGQSMVAPLFTGLGELFCSLLEEERGVALEVAGSLASSVTAEEESFFHLTGPHGLGLLLEVLEGRAGPVECARVADSQAGRFRWNRQFVRLAQAVVAGREGRLAEAESATRAAETSARPFPTARHLGLRLVAESALADGWGEPERWLTEAEEYFHRGGVVAVASACRSQLRGLGVVVRQRRAGTDRIPAELRAMGLTAREYDVFQLLVHRLGNKALAARLHLSARTVEKHVASLLTKTGTGDRVELCDFAAEFLPGAPGDQVTRRR